jgi:hypothetical protein
MAPFPQAAGMPRLPPSSRQPFRGLLLCLAYFFFAGAFFFGAAFFFAGIVIPPFL